nr:DUF4253 domain-containing protein [Kineosporia babensis]
MNSPAELMAAFRGTALDGLPVKRVPDCDDVLVIEWPEPEDLLTGWRAARDVMAVTGRRPVAVSGDDYGIHADGSDVSDDVLHDCNLEFFGPGPDELPELEAASLNPDPWPPLNRWDTDEPEEPLDLETVEHLLDFYQAGPDWDARTVARDLLPGITPSATLDVIQRHLLEKITSDPALSTPLHSDQVLKTSGALDWYVPGRVQLALLPTTSPWLAMAWLYYFGEDDTATLVACLRHWHERWGAELVASWDTMLQFTTTRRPDFGPEALELARQQLSLAGNLDMPQIHLAWDLAHTNAWFLHDRP